MIRATCGTGACQTNWFERSGAIYKMNNACAVWVKISLHELPIQLKTHVVGYGLKSAKGRTDKRHNTNITPIDKDK